MECPHKDCAANEDCTILDITGKIPKTFSSCSYSKKIKKEKEKDMDKKGFTLIEIIVVVVIVLALGVFIFGLVKSGGAVGGLSGQSYGGVSYGLNGLTETRCIEGYKFIVGEGGQARQIMDADGTGVPCR